MPGFDSLFDFLPIGAYRSRPDGTMARAAVTTVPAPPLSKYGAVKTTEAGVLSASRYQGRMRLQHATTHRGRADWSADARDHVHSGLTGRKCARTRRQGT